MTSDLPTPARFRFDTDKPHPRVWITGDDLATIRRKARDHWWARRALDRIVADAEAAARPALARIDGEPVPDLYRIDDRSKPQIIADIALASAIKQREDLAKAGRELLSTWESLHDVFGAHPDWGVTTLAVGAGLPLVALAIDLLWSHISAEEIGRLEDQLLRPAVAHLDTNRRFDSNWQTAHNGGYVSVGLLLEDENLIRRALLDPDHGLMRQLVSGVREDGMWYEGSWSYHMGVVRGFMRIAAMLQRSGIDIFHYEQPPNRLRTFLDAALHAVRPDGRMPVCGDGRPIMLSERADAYEIAYAEYGDPRYGWVIADTPRESLEALLYGAGELRSNPPEPRSHLFSTSGHCVLRNSRRGQPSAKGDSYAYLNFGTFGDWHGHPDALSVEYFSEGHGLLRCLGSPAGYHNRRHWEWYRRTLSHTTLTVDGEDQRWRRNGDDATRDLHTAGTVADFVDEDRLSAVTATHDEAYPEIRCRRHLALIDGLLVDCVDISADTNHIYDLAYHATGNLDAELPFETDRDAPREGPWQYIVNLQVAYPTQDWSVDIAAGGWPDGQFNPHGFGLRIWQEHVLDTVVRWGRSPRGDAPYGPSLIVRRRASSTRFLSLLEARAGERSKTDVIFSGDARKISLTIDREASRVYYGYALTGRPEQWSLDGIRCNARMVCAIVEDGRVAWLHTEPVAEVGFRGRTIEPGDSLELR